MRVIFIPNYSTSLVSRAKTHGPLEVVETKTQTCTYVQIRRTPCPPIGMKAEGEMWGISNFENLLQTLLARQRPIPMHLNMAHNPNIGIFLSQLEQICFCFKRYGLHTNQFLIIVQRYPRPRWKAVIANRPPYLMKLINEKMHWILLLHLFIFGKKLGRY